VINYRKDENWGDTARRLTGGRGVDHVIEVGGPSTLAQSLIAARIGGHVAMIGMLLLLSIVTRELRLRGLTVGSRRDQVEMIRAIDAAGMRPIIDRHFPLEEIVEAFRYQESNRHFGKICLDI
jgi:NADPH:quinone reductase-like Zn-dependent oxidoreductase